MALQSQGLRSSQIAAVLGVSSSCVSGLLSYGRLKQLRITVDQDVCAALAPFAARRGIGECELVRRLLTSIVDDGLVDAVLDDREGSLDA